MAIVENPAIYFMYCLVLLLLLATVKVLYKFWWTPTQVHHFISSQGIRGPSYRFFYGCTNEMFRLRKEAMETPMELSHDILRTVHPYVYTCINKYGKNFLSWLGPRSELVVTDCEMVKEIMSNRDKSYPKIVEGEYYWKKLFGKGMVTSQGERWARLRKLVHFALNAGESLKRIIQNTTVSTEIMLERWKSYEGREIEVYEEFQLLTSDVIARTAFGSNYLEGKEIFDALPKLAVLVFRNAFSFRLPIISKIFKSKDEMESEKLEMEVNSAILEIVKKREAKMATKAIDRLECDFLGLLLKAHHEANVDSSFTMREVVDECKTIYFAGQETTTSLLSWTVLLLAMHTDWQEEARKEVMQICGQNNPTLDDIEKLKTMAMIIHESLRLYTPAPVAERTTNRAVRLGDYVLKTNQKLQIPLLAVHNDPEIWGKDVHQFRPDRFSEGIAKATNNNAAAYIPFGIGPRFCVGFKLGVTEAKVALSLILQRYSFTLSPSYVHSPFQFITIQPQHGIQIILRPL